MEFRNGGEYNKIRLEIRGMDFFEECRNNMDKVIYSEDLERVAAAMDRDNLLAILEQNDSFYISYRLMIEGEPAFYSLKAVWAEGARGRHMVIGVSNMGRSWIHADVNEAGRMNNVTFSRIARALSQDYFTIYYVDSESGWFVEYSASADYRNLGIEKSGNDFFAMSRRNAQKYIYEHDRAEFLEVFTKENVLNEVRRNKTFTFTYRLLLNGEPVYVHMKISGMDGGDDTHLVVGVSNVDEQIRREQEHQNAVRVANQDPLTGVKSKHAYVEEEERINKLIRERIAEPFAVAVCDINGLKEVNDRYGHIAGDKYIKSACRKICQIFKHSPVFRVGGDEFVVILRESDFRNRYDLIAEMDLQNIASNNKGEGTIAIGLSEYRPEGDDFVSDVFARADKIMYESKDHLKNW
jgi:diguanylate cyclase (GGDEF)-like protein